MPRTKKEQEAGVLVHPGTLLGYAPHRPAKTLIEAGLAQHGYPDAVRCCILRPQDEENSQFRIETSSYYLPADIEAMRSFITGVLWTLDPADPLDEEYTEGRNEFLHMMNMGGRVVQAWHFGCGNPGCIVTVSSRVSTLERAQNSVVVHGWRYTEDQGWLCPWHAKHSAKRLATGSGSRR